MTKPRTLEHRVSEKMINKTPKLGGYSLASIKQIADNQVRIDDLVERLCPTLIKV